MRVVCIDDEYLSLQYLERQLQKVNHVDVIGTFTNPIEGVRFIIQEDIDVAFLDIQMPQMSGMELAEQILKDKPELIIIFVTAYEDYAVDAFQINAMDYLVKPVNLERLQITMERIERHMEARQLETGLSSNTLRIKVAPFLAFEVEPNVFKPLQWRTGKTQELFLYLLQNSNSIVEKSSMLDLLWNEYELDRAYALLYTTIYNIRQQLKPYEENIILHNRADGYLLELTDVEVDLVIWEEKLEQLSTIDESTIDLFEEVMHLNRGSYLASYDYIWLEGERHRLDQLWTYIANQLVAYYKKAGKITDAIQWCHAIIERFPTIEEVHFNLMKLYEANGDFTLMMQQYNELNKMLRKELETKPSNYIVEWYISKLK